MLPSKNRLSKTSDFKELALKGRPFYSSFLTLKILKESGINPKSLLRQNNFFNF